MLLHNFQNLPQEVMQRAEASRVQVLKALMLNATSSLTNKWTLSICIHLPSIFV
jgi:hypothetical protein